MLHIQVYDHTLAYADVIRCGVTALLGKLTVHKPEQWLEQYKCQLRMFLRLDI